VVKILEHIDKTLDSSNKKNAFINRHFLNKWIVRGEAISRLPCSADQAKVTGIWWTQTVLAVLTHECQISESSLYVPVPSTKDCYTPTLQNNKHTHPEDGHRSDRNMLL